jgi:preprotein translocase subunit SecG
MLTALTIGLAVILIITSVLLIVLILLHRGKGGGLSDLAEKNLDRLTVGLGLIWAASIVAVGLLVRTGS